MDQSTVLYKLQDIINYTFKNPKKLSKALTTSRANKKKNYEIYELLGDTILHLAVTEILLKKDFPDESPNTLTTARSCLEENALLALLAHKINLEQFIFSAKDESIDDVILSDVIEALVGSIYKDGGPIAAQQFIERYWLPMLNGKNSFPQSPVNVVREWEKTNNKIVLAPVTNKSKLEKIKRYNQAIAIAQGLPDKYRSRLLILPTDKDYVVNTAINTSGDINIEMPSWAKSIMTLNNRSKLQNIGQTLDLPVNYETQEEGAFIATLNFPGIPEIIVQVRTNKSDAQEQAAQKALDYLDENDVFAKKFIQESIIKKSNYNARTLLKELADYIKT